MLRAQPDRLTAWAGLALIRRQLRHGAADPLADTPELVMALYQRLAGSARFRPALATSPTG